MITKKQKWIAVAAFAAFALICTLLSLFKIPKQSNFAYENIGQLEGKSIGGVGTKTPKSSEKIFLDGYFGVNFGSYTRFDNFDTAITALRNRRVSAIWVSDVTAKYYVSQGEFRSVSPDETPGAGLERLEFAFAFRPKDGALRDKANEMINAFKDNGMTERLYNHFVNGAEDDCLCKFTEDGRTLYVGITGTVPPLEMVDTKGNVSGMAVELSKYFAYYVGMKVKFVVLDNETAFARLMSGKVDMIACFGTSENHSTEFPEYLMSDGYCGMKEYRLLVNK